MACVSCGAGMHWECLVHPCCCSGDPIELITDDSERAERQTYKRDTTLKDQQSTGRKRAAKAYPIDKDNPGPCEWQGLRSAGGGRYPIVGCSSGLQQARHHGPDKNTLNNEEGNVHRICHRCHNRWHTKNDPGYEWGNPGQSHDAKTQATPEEILDSEFYWARNKTVKAKD